MSQTIEHRALAKVRHQTTKRLYQELRGPDSFALDQAARLNAACRAAAVSIADSPYPLNSDEDTIAALIACGYRASEFTDFLDGIRAYANNRRTTS